MEEVRILRSDERETVEADWGMLTWYASAKLGNSADMTVGKCVIKPSCQNPMHSHSNCSEVLVVVQGTIMHAIGKNEEVELREGDTITLPPNVPHNACNISKEEAVLFIAYSSADRQTRGE